MRYHRRVEERRAQNRPIWPVVQTGHATPAQKTEYLPVNRDEDEAQVVLRLYRKMLLEIGEDWSKVRSADERHHSYHHI